MEWIWIVLAVSAGPFILVTVVGLLLPQGHVVSRAARYRQPPEIIWSSITDYAGQPRWCPELERVERLPDRNGHPVWQEFTRSGPPLTLETTTADAPRRLVRRIVDPDLPFGGSWIFDVGAGEDGALLIITEKGEVYNPYFRLVARLFMDPGATAEAYLRALAGKFGERVEVREVG